MRALIEENAAVRSDLVNVRQAMQLQKEVRSAPLDLPTACNLYENALRSGFPLHVVTA